MVNEVNEIWKDVHDWPFYQVSNQGRIRILPGGKIHHRLITEPELRVLTLRNGYMTITRSFSDKWGSYVRKLYVHHFVLEAFYGPCPPGEECRHLNGNRSDNRWPENIVWGTRPENYQDRISHGTDNKGERNGKSVFTQSDIIDIRNSPKSYRQLAIDYEVSRSAVAHVRKGRVWK